jgi:hypothetical protein
MFQLSTSQGEPMIQKLPRFFFLTLLLIVLGAIQAAAQTGTPVYNNIPSPLPPNVPSVGFQATQTAEFGDNVFLAGADRRAASATVTMSDWAKHSDYPTMSAAGFTHRITFKIYTVNHSGPTPALGSLIGTVSQDFLIPWRPEADPLCPGDRWRATDNQCYSGFAFKITFDLRSLALTLPNELIFGVAYNTNTWGYNPIGLPGPYESLNVGLATAMPPTVGLDVESDAVFWNTSTPANYTDGGAGGVGIFRRDDAWTPYSPAVQINAFTVASTQGGCKNNGWLSLTRADGSTFKNQGDCIQYVNTGK